jgi:hypothetical protein
VLGRDSPRPSLRCWCDQGCHTSVGASQSACGFGFSVITHIKHGFHVFSGTGGEGEHGVGVFHAVEFVDVGGDELGDLFVAAGFGNGDEVVTSGNGVHLLDLCEFEQCLADGLYFHAGAFDQDDGSGHGDSSV